MYIEAMGAMCYSEGNILVFQLYTPDQSLNCILTSIPFNDGEKSKNSIQM